MKISFPFIFVSIFLLTGCKTRSNPEISVSQIKCDGLENPAGTDRIPNFSWLLKSDIRGQIQTSYQILVRSSAMNKKEFAGDMWDSGKNMSDKSLWIPYAGKDLEPGKKYFWRVRVWDKENKPSPWSDIGEFITGLFDQNDWGGARWIGYEEIPDSLLLVPGVHGDGNDLGDIATKRTVVPYFRKEFSLEKKVTSAFVFVSGLGQYELYLNGGKVGNRFLSPGWTNYQKKCFYNTFDVTELLTDDKNVIGAIVGNGFYNINRERYRKLVIAYGAPKLILKLMVNYSDGSKQAIISDDNWKTAPSPITFSSIYGGEDYDARMEQDGWNQFGFNDSGWKHTLIVKEPSGTLKPEKDNPVTVAEVMNYKRVSLLNDSSCVFDFKQNASGIIKIKIRGKKGQEVRFTPGELLNSDSLVSQNASGGPYYFSYTLKGDNEEIWMPRFSYYGFRYVQADRAVPILNPNPNNFPVIEDIQFLHTRNSAPLAGSFKCSNELFNSIYELINWSIKSNLASVATDCPHREKLGWLEQTHLMGNSIKFQYDIHNLYDKVIDDMIESQLENGLVPDIAPEYVPFAEGFRDSPEWGSACVILPWDMYQWYGDVGAVRKAYPMMKKYVSYLQSMSKDNILSHGLGDWYDLGPKFPGEAQLTPKALTSTAIYYYDTRLLSTMAGLLGEKDDASLYSGKAEEIRESFNIKFFNPVTKVYSTGSQTAYSMPLFFGMVDNNIKKDVVKNLIKSINSNNKALTAGDIGYRYLLRVLEQEGQSQLIYEMNSKTDVPGYGYQLSKGATALTESWAALKDVSNNHMMLGHLMEWFYSGIGGLRQAPSSNSYDKIIISPDVVGNLTWAETTYNSAHGEIYVQWIIEGNNLRMKLKIPIGCKAIVAIPQTDPSGIFENENLLKLSGDVQILEVTSAKTLVEISSGGYNFRSHIN